MKLETKASAITVVAQIVVLTTTIGLSLIDKKIFNMDFLIVRISLVVLAMCVGGIIIRRYVLQHLKEKQNRQNERTYNDNQIPNR